MLRGLHKLLESGLRAERRRDPFIRSALDPFQRLGTWLIQLLINAPASLTSLGITGDRIWPDEEALTETIVSAMREHLLQTTGPNTWNARATPRPMDPCVAVRHQ